MKEEEKKVNFEEMVVYDFYSVNLDLYEIKDDCVDTYDPFQHYDHDSCYYR
jgi:hypothetical protein